MGLCGWLVCQLVGNGSLVGWQWFVGWLAMICWLYFSFVVHGLSLITNTHTPHKLPQFCRRLNFRRVSIRFYSLRVHIQQLHLIHQYNQVPIPFNFLYVWFRVIMAHSIITLFIIYSQALCACVLPLPMKIKKNVESGVRLYGESNWRQWVALAAMIPLALTR